MKPYSLDLRRRVLDAYRVAKARNDNSPPAFA